MGLAEAIAKAQAALDDLKNGSYEIITRASPCTWGDLKEELENKLVPILYKLFNEIGGLKVIPEVVLPDGVTSTSLVSQSEMVQFVTNTLDTWLVQLMQQVQEAKKDTIFALQPAVVAYKYVPHVIPVNLSAISQSFECPQITATKATFHSHAISLIEMPTISAPGITVEIEG